MRETGSRDWIVSLLPGRLPHYTINTESAYFGRTVSLSMSPFSSSRRTVAIAITRYPP